MRLTKPSACPRNHEEIVPGLIRAPKRICPRYLRVGLKKTLQIVTINDVDATRRPFIFDSFLKVNG